MYCQSGDSNPSPKIQSPTLYHHPIEPQVEERGIWLARILVLAATDGFAGGSSDVLLSGQGGNS